MKVTLDVDAIQPQLSGIGRYAWELSCGLRNHPAVSRLNLYARGRLIDDPQVLLSGEPRPRRKLFRKPAAMLDRLRLRGGVFHGPNYFLPTFVESGVITVHDLSVLKFPETHPAARVADFERRLGSSISRASQIITDTETVRQEVLEAFTMPADRVTAVPLGVDRSFRPRTRTEVAACLAEYGLEPQGYGLCVSTLEPRKKISELILAWGRLSPAIRNRFPLALAGGGGWRNETLKQEIAQAAGAGWLRPLGFVPESDLHSLYAGAALFTYPSTYEGFGLPLLEAMASGIPTLVANQSCLPEVCGEAALYVDPADIEDFTRKLEQALEDERLRSSLIERGLARAATYTWSRCMDLTVQVYARAAMA